MLESLDQTQLEKINLLATLSGMTPYQYGEHIIKHRLTNEQEPDFAQYTLIEELTKRIRRITLEFMADEVDADMTNEEIANKVGDMVEEFLIDEIGLYQMQHNELFTPKEDVHVSVPVIGQLTHNTPIVVPNRLMTVKAIMERGEWPYPTEIIAPD